MKNGDNENKHFNIKQKISKSKNENPFKYKIIKKRRA